MNWFKQKLTSGLSKKVALAVFVLAAIDILSMTAPFYLKYVIPDIHNYLGVSQAQFDQLNAVLGYVTLAMQLPSGWIADKLSGKKVLTLSATMTGVLTILFGIACQGFFGDSSLVMLYIIFSGFGISATLFLWSPLWKVLSSLGNDKEQGKLYGLEGSYNGFLGLIIVTLIGTIATEMSSHGNNTLFYVLLYLIAALLFVSAFGTWFFVPENNQKSSLLLSIKSFFKNLKSDKKGFKWLKPLKIFRVWMLAFFVMGMYMLQSIFAYYLKDYMAIVSSAIIVTIFAGFRAYGLRLLISAPFGNWLEKRKSWVFVSIVILAIGILVAILIILLAGFGNNITPATNASYLLALQIVFPILFTLIGIMSWLLVTSRYAQISEIPHQKETYGMIVAFISFIAFSSDAWFYQMAASWMQTSGHIMTEADVAALGYGSVGSYDQAGLQLLLLVALGISAFGLICGIIVFIINKQELKKLHKQSYRWRIEATKEVAIKTKQGVKNE